MSDPRLSGSHLSQNRQGRYVAAVEAMLDCRGPLTSEADPLTRPPSRLSSFIPREDPVTRSNLLTQSQAQDIDALLDDPGPLTTSNDLLAHPPSNDLLAHPPSVPYTTVPGVTPPPSGVVPLGMMSEPKSVNETLHDRAGSTAIARPLAQPIDIPPPSRRSLVPPGGTYTLIRHSDGRRYELRTGINSLGRFPNNDIIVKLADVSRRHCVIVVHATGGCEVHDTASWNGVWLNDRRVGVAHFLPGDVMRVATELYELDWVGPAGEKYRPERETKLAVNFAGSIL